jgi:hypothetical protein
MRCENKRNTFNAVLKEQDRQWENDIDDHDDIARVFLKHTKTAAKSALLRGLKDHEESIL